MYAFNKNSEGGIDILQRQEVIKRIYNIFAVTTVKLSSKSKEGVIE